MIPLLERLHLGLGRGIPLTLQSEAAECGLACLAMVSGFHGGSAEIAELRRRLAVSLKGINLKDLIGMADRLGLAARPVRLELDELPLLKTPCILHWDLNHFVVLKHASRGGIAIHDPAAGMRQMPMSEVSAHFTGVALELTPVAGFEPAASAPRVKFRSVVGRLVGIRRYLGQLFVLAAAIELFAIMSPLLLQFVVDHALVAADRHLLLTLALGFCLLVVLRTVVTAMRGWMTLVLGASLKVQGGSNLFSHLVRLPTSFFEARHLGDVLSRFESQNAILRAFTTDLVESLLDGVLAVVTAAIMVVFCPPLAVAVAAAALLYALLRWMSYAPLRHASMESIVWAARRDTHLLETLRGIKTIKLFNAQESRRAQWLNLVVETVNRDLGTQKLRLLFRTANLLLMGGLGVIVIWLGALRVLDNLMTVGMLLAFIAYKDQFMDRVSALIDRLVDLTMLRLHGERLADIALTAPESWPHRSEAAASGPPIALEVRDLSFRYADNEPWVLDGVSFTVEPGETVAIVGPSGRGKTTLLKILASLLQPTRGELLVDGEPLAQFGVARWRSSIGVVMQDDQLFAGSVADNISFFSDSPDALRVEACARAAAVHDDIVAMPMGYGTLIGDMGTALSGGQKQRVLIARALYREPRLLLLDEATSHLDLAAESVVNVAIRQLKLTRILVAHRPETIRIADRVISLDPEPVATTSFHRRITASTECAK